MAGTPESILNLDGYHSLDDGTTYFLRGHKNISDDPGRLDLVEDMTLLFTTLHRGEDERAPIHAAGELYFKLTDAPALMASMEVRGAASWRQNLAAYMAFAPFAFGALRDEYLMDLRLFYDTQYENLVLSGTLQNDDGRTRPFFLASGTHDKGFPWGDPECFSDVLPALGNEAGHYETCCITARVLEGLEEDVAAGTYRYNGPLFLPTDGYSASFSQMHAPGNLSRCSAEIKIDFESCPFDTVPVSFPIVPQLVRKMSSAMMKALRDALPAEAPAGHSHHAAPGEGSRRQHPHCQDRA